MVKNTIVIGHLYPQTMNVYGDMGNVITLQYRLKQRGFKVVYKEINSLKELQASRADVLIGGGGQDSNQGIVQEDLQRYAKELKAHCKDGLVALMVCGMYQLFGHRFVLSNESTIPGIGFIDMETYAGDDRLIGNCVVKSDYGTVVGFENHSGRTYLGKTIKPLGIVTKGAGNNGFSKDEGAVVQNVFGTYMHGPVLAKNPELADEMIRRILHNKNNDLPLKKLDNKLENAAAEHAMRRPH